MRGLPELPDESAVYRDRAAIVRRSEQQPQNDGPAERGRAVGRLV